MEVSVPTYRIEVEWRQVINVEIPEGATVSEVEDLADEAADAACAGLPDVYDWFGEEPPVIEDND